MWINNISTEQPQAHQAFSSLEAVFALEGEVVTKSGLCTVTRVMLDNRTYYIKKYQRSGEGLSVLAILSKARREWSNLLTFSQWGLPAAQLAAYGEQPRWKLPRKAVVITRGIDCAPDLAQLYKENAAELRDPQWVRAVSSQVAHATRVMHQHNFAHNDWKWRNILVRNTPNGPEMFMIDCPAGQRWPWPFFEYRRVKDLACLDKIANKVLSRTQRLRFYLEYCQRQRLNKEDKAVIHKITGFFKGRE